MSTLDTSTTTPTPDNNLLHSLLHRLQLQIPPSPILPTSFDDVLSDHLSNFSDNNDTYYDYDEDNKNTSLSNEELNLEKEIIKIILSGNTKILNPNSGQAVSIGEHYVCVGFYDDEEGESGYRVWEWHGHVMLFDDHHGFTPEYIYDNYFKRVIVGSKRGEKEKNEGQNGNLGLKELIDNGGRVGFFIAVEMSIQSGAEL